MTSRTEKSRVSRNRLRQEAVLGVLGKLCGCAALICTVAFVFYHAVVTRMQGGPRVSPAPEYQVDDPPAGSSKTSQLPPERDRGLVGGDGPGGNFHQRSKNNLVLAAKAG